MSKDRLGASDGSRIYWRRAMALALVALSCGLFLGGLSAWFLGAVAIAGLSSVTALVFNFHVPGGLVRLFALGRTVARYGERLAGHKAALTDQVNRRVDLFRGMALAPAVRALGWQLGDQAKLADYLDDVEDLDFGRLRIELPLATIGLGGFGLVVATAVVAPIALLPIALIIVMIGTAARSVLQSSGPDLSALRDFRRAGAQNLGAAIASAVPLRAEVLFSARRNDAFAALADADRALFQLRRRIAGFDVLSAFAGPCAALSVVLAAWITGRTGAAMLIPVFVAFAWFAFAETLQGAGRILLASMRRTAAREVIEQWLEPAPGVFAAQSLEPENRSPKSIREIAHAGLQRIGPSNRPLGLVLDLHFSAGRPTIITGASGSGKTSLLKQIGGWIGDDILLVDGREMDPDARRAISMLCLHDAAILSDTIRANLFAPFAKDAEIWEAIRAVEMERRIEQAGGLDGWISQDVLSLGEAQRLNLARAWLSKSPIILLDEPTEHLTSEQGALVFTRLTARLSERILVASSHHVRDFPDAAFLNLD